MHVTQGYQDSHKSILEIVQISLLEKTEKFYVLTNNDPLVSRKELNDLKPKEEKEYWIYITVMGGPSNALPTIQEHVKNIFSIMMLVTMHILKFFLDQSIVFDSM